MLILIKNPRRCDNKSVSNMLGNIHCFTQFSSILVYAMYIQPIIRKATTKIDDNVIRWFLSIIRQIRPKSSISIV